MDEANDDLYIMDADELKDECKKCWWRIEFIQQQIDSLKGELETHKMRVAICHDRFEKLRNN